MDINNILDELKAERDRLERAINALQGVGSGARGSRRGRKGRHMSAEARARISAAMKKRWAQRRKAA